MIDAIILRGCGDSLNNHNSPPWWIADRLDPNRFRTSELNYAASIGPANPEGSPTGKSLAQSTAEALPMLGATIRATPNLVMLIGYSQGAYTASRFLEAKLRGEFADCEVPWLVLVANPLRPEGIGMPVRGSSDAPPGFGIAGQRRLSAWHHIIEVAHPEDGITSCPWDSRLRTVADLVDPLSFALGGGWFQGLAEKTLRNDWQAVLTSWRPGMPLPDPGAFAMRAWRDAQLVDGYLRTGKHGPAYWEDGLLQAAVDRINETVRP